MFVAGAATKARLYSFRAPLLRLDYVRSGRRYLGSTVSIAGADPCRASTSSNDFCISPSVDAACLLLVNGAN